MKKIDLQKDILPHAIAVVVFYIITVAFFSPAILSNKSLSQHDIEQWEGASKELRDYREETGKEGLWANSMFSGMPAYLVNVEWSDQVVRYIKSIISLGLPHPVRQIFLAFLCYYILLLCFKIRPLLALPGAIAFGLSSYMIIGMSAGHNARIGAIAFTPLVVAGIHLLFQSDRKWKGLALFALGTALHLRENHLQITYYLLIVLFVYMLAVTWENYRAGSWSSYLKNIGLALAAGLIALGTYSGKFWTTLEYSKYSIRGKSDLSPSLLTGENKDGLSKAYAFEYSNGILEPMTLLIPDFYGGSSSDLLVSDRNSASYKALARSQDQQTALQLSRFTSSYWGNQRLAAPYYAGAIIIFLAVFGALLAERRWAAWLVGISVLGIVLSWGSSFQTFNYFMFDHFPGYDKFRSVTFALYFPLFALPLLGSIGLERAIGSRLDAKMRKKLLIALASTGGLCLLVFMFAGMASFSKDMESQLPNWFLSALQEDRKGLMRADALRSLGFILAACVIIYLGMLKRIKFGIMVLLLTLASTIDLFAVGKRYLSEDRFQRKGISTMGNPTNADRTILQDTGDYRVYSIIGDAFVESRTSYFHQSVGGYHGAKLRRYQELYDLQIHQETQELINGLQSGTAELSRFGVLNMLNIKYFTFGAEANNVISNPEANGPAWWVQEVTTANSPDEVIDQLGGINTKTTALINTSEFDLSPGGFSKDGSITIEEKLPGYIKYSSNNSGIGFAVFSEIYYPEGWTATIDGEPADIYRVNYTLRGLKIEPGEHVIEFTFAPRSYVMGNKIVLASNILLGLLLVTSIYFSIKNNNEEENEIK